MQELEIQSSTSMNMTVDLDTDPQTDPTYEDTTDKAFVVVSPLNVLVSDPIEQGATEFPKV